MNPGPAVPVCRIIAGPNGAGKTTFALTYLPQVAPGSGFVNADLIAAGLSPLAPDQHLVAASRLFLQQIRGTPGGATRLRVRDDARRARVLAPHSTAPGLRLADGTALPGAAEGLYLALPKVELSRQRVAERVAHGGHAIPDAAITRRFPRSLRNLFDHYADAVDHTVCFLNTSSPPHTVFTQRDGSRRILDQSLYDALVKEAGR